MLLNTNNDIWKHCGTNLLFLERLRNWKLNSIWKHTTDKSYNIFLNFCKKREYIEPHPQ